MIRHPGARLAACLVIPLALVAAQVPANDDEAAEQMALGRLTFDNSCRMCHEPELVRQQRLTPAQWDAEITKMIDWGATVAPDERPNLLAFLAAEFGPRNRPETRSLATPLPKPTRADFVPPAATVSTQRGATLYERHCATCHGPDARGGEPGQNLVEQEALLAPGPFAAIVAAGRHKMPAFAEVLDPAAVEEIRAWLLTRTYDPGPSH